MKQALNSKSKKLLLYCVPIIEKGVGSAWGLPIIAQGKERISALDASLKLQAPGMYGNQFSIILPRSTRSYTEENEELKTIGIGPLGRYVGGEPIKPVPLSARDFLRAIKTKQNETPSLNSANSAPYLFTSGLEFKDTYWRADGTTEQLFHSHLEFLRQWGFSGGLYIEQKEIPRLTAGYIKYLQKESALQKPRIMLLVSKQYYESALSLPLQVLGPDFSGIEIIFCQDLALLHSQKVSSDILIIINTDNSTSGSGISARLCLSINSVNKSKDKPDTDKLSIAHFLFRNLADKDPKTKIIFTNHASWIPLIKQCKDNALSAHENQFLVNLPRSTRSYTEENEEVLLKTPRSSRLSVGQRSSAVKKPKLNFLMPTGQDALSTEEAFGCTFMVNTRFGGLKVSDFRDEQSLFYHEVPLTNNQNWNPPPVRYGASFYEMNDIQKEFFISWRSECRRGFAPFKTDKQNESDEHSYIETYLLLYAKELVLCMGKESPMRHFNALLNLYHDCEQQNHNHANSIPITTTSLLLQWLLDFAIVYGIATEALPLLLDELLNNNGFETFFALNSEAGFLLANLAIHYFFIEKDCCLDSVSFWPFIKTIIPRKIIARKENDQELPVLCCRTLNALDALLKRDWGKGFFSLFCPPLPSRADYTAFEQFPSSGLSSYTVASPCFSAHKPLVDLLVSIVLDPLSNPLPGVKARLNPLSLENELLEELREESNAVREMLKTETYDQPISPEIILPQSTRLWKAGECPPINNYFAIRRALARPYTEERMKLISKCNASISDQTIGSFIDSLNESERDLIKSIINNQIADISKAYFLETAIDSINEAFYDRFGDLLIENTPQGFSISSEYADIIRSCQ